MNAKEARKLRDTREAAEKEHNKEVAGILKGLEKQIKRDPHFSYYEVLSSDYTEVDSDLWTSVKSALVEKGYEVNVHSNGIDLYNEEEIIMSCNF